MENCGLFGVHAGRNCASDLFYGLFKLQHRGQRYCGMAVRGRRIRLSTHKGHVRHTFTAAGLSELPGRAGIGHVSLSERQPVLVESRLGQFAFAFSGFIRNSRELAEDLKNRGHSFSTGTEVELLAKIVAQGNSFADGLLNLASRVRGSYTILVLAPEGVYAARDPYGFKPFILGRRADGYAVSSESRPFNLTGFEIARDILPGEVVLVNGSGVSSLGRTMAARTAHCAFEWGYTASMDSVIEGVPVVTVRNRLGGSLARRNRVAADLVAAVPFSGIGYALGYHHESGLPYDEVFLFDRFSSRSYLPLSQPERDLEARVKLSVVSQVVKGRRIVLCDDSIVRGTQIRNKVRELKQAGAREVHVRIGCPPLLSPCRYDISTRSYRELAARRHRTGEIAALIGADSLEYNTIEDLVAAIGLPAGRLCLACWRRRQGAQLPGRFIVSG